MIKVAIIGAAGRMGQRLISNVVESDDLVLSGAVEAAESPFLGMDAGDVAGVGSQGVMIVEDLNDGVINADAVIDFSTGKAVDHAEIAVSAGCAIVIGTTALTDIERARLAELGAEGGRLVVASNMSVGVNLLFCLCRQAAAILGENYDIEIVEMHHNQKKDAPSGTAVTLAETICEATGRSYKTDVVHGRQGMVGARTSKEIGMHAVRGGDVVGDHTVIFATGGERVELTHKASSRDTFAKGALRAVRFLATVAPGFYDMQDVLNLKRSFNGESM